MGEAGRISWGRLILGVLCGLPVTAALVALLGPLAAATLSGGSHYQIRDNAMAPALIARWLTQATVRTLRGWFWMS